MSGARVVAELAGDGTGFERMLNRANAQLGNFEGGVNGVKNQIAGLFALGALGEGVRSVITLATHLKDLSRQTGLSTEEIQRIGYAAKQSGLEFEDFQVALSRMGTARQAAAESNNILLHSFKSFGITLADLQNPALRNIDLMNRISQAIKGVNLNAGQRQELREFFGKSGDKLAEAIANLDEFKDRAIVSDKDIDSIDRFSKSVQAMTDALKAAAASPIATVADSITAALNLMNQSSFIENAWAYSYAKGDKKGQGLADNYRHELARFDSDPAAIAAARDALEKHLKPTMGQTVTFEGKEYQNPLRQPRLSITPGVRYPSGDPEAHDTFHSPDAEAKGDLFVDERKIKLMQEQAKLMEEQFQNSLKLLTPEEKRNKLIEEANELLTAAKELEKGGDAKGGVTLRQRRESVIGEIEGIRDPKLPQDSLSRVGNFLGGGVQSIPNIQSKIIQDNTSSIRTLTPTIKELIRAVKESTKAMDRSGNPNGVPPV